MLWLTRNENGSVAHAEQGIDKAQVLVQLQASPLETSQRRRHETLVTTNPITVAVTEQKTPVIGHRQGILPTNMPDNNLPSVSGGHIETPCGAQQKTGWPTLLHPVPVLAEAEASIRVAPDHAKPSAREHNQDIRARTGMNNRPARFRHGADFSGGVHHFRRAKCYRVCPKDT